MFYCQIICQLADVTDILLFYVFKKKDIFISHDNCLVAFLF